MDTEHIDVSLFKPIRYEKPEWSDDGVERPVYSIPLSMLYYNKDNGRIASWISGYDEEHPINPLGSLYRETFNREIEKLIKKTGKVGSFEKTKQDIRIKGQLRPGLVLSDGRVMDGNRRFTVLRDLYEETSSDKFANFECFVYDVPVNEGDWKTLKRIERRAQFDVDEKSDYDATEKLVEAYQDLLAPNHLLTLKEYRDIYHLKEGEARDMQTRAQIMIDYLEFIGQPLKFYIVRARKLDGPINELARLYRSVDAPEWNRIRPLFYAAMYQEGSRGDRTRDVRGLISAYNSPTIRQSNFEDALDRVNQDLEQSELKHLAAKPATTPAPMAEVEKETKPKVVSEPEVSSASTQISSETQDMLCDVSAAAKADSARRKPLQKARESYESLNEIDIDAVNHMSPEEKSNLHNSLDMIEGRLSTLKKLLG